MTNKQIALIVAVFGIINEKYTKVPNEVIKDAECYCNWLEKDEYEIYREKFDTCPVCGSSARVSKEKL